MCPRRRILAALAAVTLWSGCTDESVSGGSGSDAGNALEVVAIAPGGGVVPGARVELRPEGSSAVHPTYVDTTDVDGRVMMRPGGGRWAVLVVREHLAFRAVASGAGAILDTLRPTARLSGLVDGGAGAIVTLTGIGIGAVCDSSGYFELDGLPSGASPVLLAAGTSAFGTGLELPPGVRSLALFDTKALPPQVSSLPADSLIPWGGRPLPAGLPTWILGDTGAFAIAVRLRRLDTALPLVALDWGGSDSTGIRIGWHGLDTLVLDLAGRRHRIVGIPFPLGEQQVGLAGEGRRLSVLLGRDTVASLSTGVLEARPTWTSLAVGVAGAQRVDWIAFQRRVMTADWLRRLWAL